MIRPFAVLCLLASPALADDTAYCGESVAALRPGVGDAVAEVIILNRYSAAPTDCQSDISLHGLNVVIQFANQPGRTPDAVRVIVPSGFFAIPPEVTLEEDEQGVIEIFAIEGAYS
jgi:hypothetical protein